MVVFFKTLPATITNYYEGSEEDMVYIWNPEGSIGASHKLELTHPNDRYNHVELSLNKFKSLIESSIKPNQELTAKNETVHTGVVTRTIVSSNYDLIDF